MANQHAEYNRESAPRHVSRDAIRKHVRRLSACVALALGLAPAVGGLPAATLVQAATLTVCPSGPPECQYKHIQDAINAASPGDTISIAAGTYAETLTIPISLTLTGAGADRTIVNGNHTGTAVTANTGATVAIGGLTIQNGFGDGIFNYSDSLTLTNSTISGNSAYDGGGINNSNGTVTVINSTISGNSATNRGGGIDNYGGTVNLTNSTISGNSATDGGGINNFAGPVTVINSTISGNTAPYGGGIYTLGPMTLTNSTASGNSATVVAGGVYIYAGPLTLANTILAANTAPSDADCFGTLTSGGYNLVGIGDGCGLTNGVNGDQVGSARRPINPLLGPLQNNGGPTQTMAELKGSPAINKVSRAHCPLRTDQRGQPRPDPGDHGVCDVGAFERQDG